MTRKARTMPVSKAAVASVVAGLAVAAAAAGCGTTAAPDLAPPATVQPVPGSRTPQIRLTPQAVQRTGIRTRAVWRGWFTVDGRRQQHLAIPYAAVVYDNNGSTWSYVNTSARTYQRKPISVQIIQGGTAILSSGPPPGTQVVTVGGPELLGTEYNINGEQ